MWSTNTGREVPREKDLIRRTFIGEQIVGGKNPGTSLQ